MGASREPPEVQIRDLVTPALRPGELYFGKRYRLERELGRGGMGVVWLAWAEHLNQPVALKFLPNFLADDRVALDDLKRETKRSLELTHHHIVRIHDFHLEDGVAAISMEYVEGQTLRQLLRAQPGGCFDVATIRPWIAHLCAALSYAHETARIAHRDLKPGNVLINKASELKVADFGIAASLRESVIRATQQPCGGTPCYMSPQQFAGELPTATDDLYALGVTIYELLTGRPPFGGADLGLLAATIAHEVPPPMGERRRELGMAGAASIPAEWEQTVAACLEKDRAKRPLSASEVACRLAAPAVSRSTPVAPAKRRLRLAAASLVAAGIGAAALLIASRTQPKTASLPPDPTPARTSLVSASNLEEKKFTGVATVTPNPEPVATARTTPPVLATATPPTLPTATPPAKAASPPLSTPTPPARTPRFFFTPSPERRPVLPTPLPDSGSTAPAVAAQATPAPPRSPPDALPAEASSPSNPLIVKKEPERPPPVASGTSAAYVSSADFAKYALKLRESALLRMEPHAVIPTTTRTLTVSGRYPWKTGIVTTTFWVGEPTGGKKGARNVSSSWDTNWMQSFGGYDNPAPAARRNFIPVNFIPRQNPFYIALPYNDVGNGNTKPEAKVVIPWFKETFVKEGDSVCRDRWVCVRNSNGKVCYAQWSDCGPARTDHWQYVFGNERPKPNANAGAGLNIAPAVRDFLDLGETDVTDWKFVDFKDVPKGPWALYGDNNHFVQGVRTVKEGVSSNVPAPPLPARTVRPEDGPMIIIRPQQ